MQKTLENLAKAFIGESQARNRYTIYAKAAKTEGFEQMRRYFWKPPTRNASTPSNYF